MVGLSRGTTRAKIERDKERMREQKKRGVRVTALHYWAGIEEFISSELGLHPGVDVFVPNPHDSPEVNRANRARFIGKLRYREAKETVEGAIVRPRRLSSGVDPALVEQRLVASYLELGNVTKEEELATVASHLDLSKLEVDGEKRFELVEIDFTKLTPDA